MTPVSLSPRGRGSGRGLTLSELNWLQSWYAKHCDGEWEHSYGVRIDTIDNPGWSLKIDLIGTELAQREFVRRNESQSDDDWYSAWVEQGVFSGACGPRKLEALIAAFREWAEP